jgi:hypothetical protein
MRTAQGAFPRNASAVTALGEGFVLAGAAPEMRSTTTSIGGDR